MRLASDGLAVDLPPGWEGQITTARPVDSEAIAQHRRVTGKAPSVTPTAHLANFALPSARGDFGSGAVEVMGTDHAFVALVEYGEDEAGSALFAAPLPLHIAATDLHPRSLQRTLAGQAGFQCFGHVGGRPFALYVVLGRDRNLDALVGEVNDVLASLRVDTR